jgi:hypothetical protein
MLYSAEWTSEGNQKWIIYFVSEYVRRVLLPVTKSRHMVVCTEWMIFIKPGGTAGSI